MDFRPYQNDCHARTLAELARVRSTCVVAPTGCHRRGQKILMYSGAVKPVEDVRAGDLLMGPDGTSRLVLSLCRGVGEMVRIVPTKGEPWVVNRDHVLTLQRVRQAREGNCLPSENGGEVVDVTVSEWLQWPKWRKHIHKLFRVPADFEGVTSDPPPIDPYLLGVLLGDGSLAGAGSLCVCTGDPQVIEAIRPAVESAGLSFREERRDHKGCVDYYLTGGVKGKRNRITKYLRSVGLKPVRSEERFIPAAYKAHNREVRLQVLAGLIDTDGSRTYNGYDYISKSQQLAEDVAFVARSVGLAAYVQSCQKRCQNGTGGTYYRVSISGECSTVPVRVSRKKCHPRRQKKSVLRTSFQVEELGAVEDYYGFTLTGDGRYLLGDFTVTHNTGKAVMLGRLAADWPQGKTIILAHRRKLLTQAGDKLSRLGKRAALECGEDRLDSWDVRHSSVILASKDSLHENRIKKFNPADFGLVLIDECHHASKQNKTYRRVFDWFGQNPECSFAGYTATIDRSDSSQMIGHGKPFETCAYEYPLFSLRDEPNAICDGWLVPLRQEYVTVEGLDFSKLKLTAGDWTDKDLDAVLAEEEVLHQVAAPLAEIASDRPTIVFCATKAHAAGVHDPGKPARPGMVDVLNRYRPGSAAAILGDTPEELREHYYREFRRGKLQYLVGCDVMTEGLDLPEVACVAICRPTKSRNRYAQMAGRSTRPREEIVNALNAEPDAAARRAIIAASAKPDGLIVDFVGVGHLKLAVSVADILAQAEDDAESMERGMRKASKKGDTSAESLKQAVREAGEEIQMELWREAARGLMAELKERERIVAQAQYSTETQDPLGGYQMQAERSHAAPMKAPPTDKQVELLVNLGVKRETAAGYSRGQAGSVINSLKDRRCTDRQAGVLRRFDVNPEEHNYHSAKEVIDKIAANGWRRFS